MDLRNQRNRAQVAARRVQCHSHDDRMRRQVAVTDRGHEVVDRPELVEAGDLVQLRLGQCGPLEVRISTISPFCRAYSRGTMRPFTLAPTQRCPTSVWMR